MTDTDFLVCDSSSLISLTSSCLDSLLYFLKKEYGIRFLIPRYVEKESVTTPLSKGLKEYAFSARKIKKAIKDGILEIVENNSQARMNEILNMSNNMLFVRGKPLRLVHAGEAEMLAIAADLGGSAVLMDERTTRMLIEAPFRMKEHLEEEFNVNIMFDRNAFTKFTEMTKGCEIVRSSELLILGYELGFMDDFGGAKKEALEAALYKIKYSGCSISFDEINKFIRSL